MFELFLSTVIVTLGIGVGLFVLLAVLAILGAVTKPFYRKMAQSKGSKK